MSEVKIVAVSDLHGHLPEIPECDILLIAGDICPVYDHKIPFQAAWLDGAFAPWLMHQPAAETCIVWGNHDFIGERSPELVPEEVAKRVLNDRLTISHGLQIYGTPWQPRFMDWAFNLDQAELYEKWAMIPEGIDILITHSPPYGYGDVSLPHGRRPSMHCGSADLLMRLEVVKPRLHVFGHIHEGRGQWRFNDSTLANVTLVDHAYRRKYKPSTFTLLAN